MPLWLGAKSAYRRLNNRRRRKVDEQTLMQNRIREEEKKRQMAEEARRRPPEKPAQSVQRAPQPEPSDPVTSTTPQTGRRDHRGPMRMDYLYRFWDAFGDDGFKRLVEKGLSVEPPSATPTPDPATPPSSRAPPPLHGIIGNGGYDRTSGNSVYCASAIRWKPSGFQMQRSLWPHVASSHGGHHHRNELKLQPACSPR